MFSFFKKQLTPQQKIARLLESIQRLSKVVEIRCVHGDYATLRENYKIVQECFDKVLLDKVYQHLTVEDKEIIFSMLIRTAKVLKKHDRLIQYDMLVTFLRTFLEKSVAASPHKEAYFRALMIKLDD